MNRRSFLKLLASSAALSVVGLPKLEVNYYKFDPRKRYGNMVISKEKWSVETVKTAKDLLIKDMETVVPTQYRKNVRFIARAVDFGRYTSAGWLYKPNGDFSGFGNMEFI